VYFISKGTVSFCLGKDQGEKEIKEFKKRKLNFIFINDLIVSQTKIKNFK
jgi:hypothetical protein